jgi:transcriptional regulator with XRE-family HTH domain
MVWKYYVSRYENGKMRPGESILKREGRVKEKDGGSRFKVYFKHFCNCHKILPVKQ